MYNDFPVWLDEHGLKSLYVVLIFFSLMLQSCHNTLQTYEERRAAQYNMQLGLAYLSQGNINLAKKKLLRSFSQNPNSASINSSLAYFMEAVGDEKKADEYYRRAMRIAPKSGAELNKYGSYLCRNNYYEKAEQYFMLAVNDVDYQYTATAYENAGLCLIKVPNNKKAVAYFKKALLHDPSRTKSLKEIVRIELMQNRIRESCEFMHRYRGIVNNDIELSKLKRKLCS
ncbi:MAG: type IV pilus biogenesis/stability protein PilW [Legionellaceae bacterium]|nr:type IV pilus biogenesis/stability protein PilW [Legionellaceae bacterium]